MRDSHMPVSLPAKSAETASQVCCADGPFSMDPLHVHIGPGDVITIQWSGELRTVVVEATGDVVLRDLTEAEVQDLNEAAHDAHFVWP